MPKQQTDELEVLNAFCVENAELERLEVLLDQFNIFEAAGLVRQETKHSNFLGFLLDPRQPHGLGATFLEMFLQHLVEQNQVQTAVLSPLHFHLWDLDETDINREWNSVDILIRSDTHRFVVVIENKVNIGEHSNQLTRYRELVEGHFPNWKTLFVLLSSDGLTADNEPSYASLSYQSLVSLIDKLLERKKSTLSFEVSMVITHYRSLLERYLMNENEIDRLCSEIYRKHKRAIDIINRKRKNRRIAIREYFEGVIARTEDFIADDIKTTAIKFYPKEWEEFNPVVSSSPSGEERRLFYCLILNEEGHVTFFVEMREVSPKWLSKYGRLREFIHSYALEHRPLRTHRREMSSTRARIFKKEMLRTTDYQLPDDAFDVKRYNAWNRIQQVELPLLTKSLREAVRAFESQESKR